MATAQNRGKWVDYLYAGGWSFTEVNEHLDNYLVSLVKPSIIFVDIHTISHYSIRFMGMLGKFIIINYIFRSVCMCVLVYCVVIL